MSLNLYRRHKRKCFGAHPEQSRSGELEERRKGWKKCDCPIMVSGTLKGKFNRKTSEQTDWDKARETVNAWKSWDGELPLPPPDAPPPSSLRITIEKAVRAYNLELADSHAVSTVRGYGYLLEEFQAFSTARGYVYLDQWQPFDMREFRTSWNVKLSTARRKMATVKAFFSFIESNGWLESNPAAEIRKRNTRKEKDAENSPRIPFSDLELTQMYALCDSAFGMGLAGKQVDGKRRRWKGGDIRDFIAVSLYTGLRISDVATFNADRLTPTGACRLRATKNGVWVETWLPAWLQEDIRVRVETYGNYIFGARQSGEYLNNSEQLIRQWRDLLDKLWRMRSWDMKPVHHRFRHTFVRILLEHGVPVQDIADLIGDTETTLRKHYSQWMPERQAHLRGVLQMAFADRPLPNVIPIR